MNDTYDADFKDAKESGDYWIICISEDWCGACQHLKRKVKELEAKGIRVRITYLKTDSENAIKIRATSNLEKGYIPWWSVWKFSDETFKMQHEQIGIDDLENLLRKYKLS